MCVANFVTWNLLKTKSETIILVDEFLFMTANRWMLNFISNALENDFRSNFMRDTWYTFFMLLHEHDIYIYVLINKCHVRIGIYIVYLCMCVCVLSTAVTRVTNSRAIHSLISFNLKKKLNEMNEWMEIIGTCVAQFDTNVYTTANFALTFPSFLSIFTHTTYKHGTYDD